MGCRFVASILVEQGTGGGSGKDGCFYCGVSAGRALMEKRGGLRGRGSRISCISLFVEVSRTPLDFLLWIEFFLFGSVLLEPTIEDFG